MPVISAPPGFDEESAPERYILLAKLAAGGMGETFRAWDRRDGRLVAIKMPKVELAAAPGFLERFDREARMLQRMWHPNIVPINDIGMLNGRPFFAMPFLPGGSLSARRLRDDEGKPLPNQVGALHYWLPAMSAALDHLHAQGVVHRDVKPANIFFDVFWQAFLGDFGVAKVVDDGGGMEREETLTGTNMAMGTEFYMAPEMFAPRPRLSAAIDQYALAVTAYELLAGRRPFTGESINVIVEVTTQSPPPLTAFRSDLPASLVHAVHRGLAKRPEDRFSSCGEFCQTVLAHVRPLQAEPGIARLACPSPKCKFEHIIRISTGDAGRTGKCPKCRSRLVIAEDLSGLWTREEQEIVSAELAGQPAAAADGQGPREIAAEEEPVQFKPLSKSVPVKKPHVRRIPSHFVTIAIVALSLVGLGAIWWRLQPRPGWVIDRKASVTIDDGRLVAFGPRGFERSSQSRKFLVEYTRRDPGRTLRIRVLPDDLSPNGAAAVKVGDRQARIWTKPAAQDPRLGGRATSTNCSLKIGDKIYTVEVVTTSSQVKEAEHLCILVAGALAPQKRSLQPPPPERTGLKVEYFIGRDLQKKIDYPDPICNTDMQFDWFVGPAVSGLPHDDFSIRWTGFFIPKTTGRHRFVGYRDNGLRVWVNSELLVDEWNNRWGEFTSTGIYLYKGKRYPIKIEYYERNGGAGLTLKVKEEIGEAKVLEPSQLRPAP
jgi:hypothetical protein